MPDMGNKNDAFVLLTQEINHHKHDECYYLVSLICGGGMPCNEAGASVNGLLPDGTKPLPGPILTCHHWELIAWDSLSYLTFCIILQRNGFFVECGALDGERASNTLHMEQELGWTGLLGEVDPFFFLQLIGHNRKSYAVNACLSPQANVATVSHWDPTEYWRLNCSRS